MARSIPTPTVLPSLVAWAKNRDLSFADSAYQRVRRNASPERLQGAIDQYRDIVGRDLIALPSERGRPGSSPYTSWKPILHFHHRQDWRRFLVNETIRFRGTLAEAAARDRLRARFPGIFDQLLPRQFSLFAYPYLMSEEDVNYYESVSGERFKGHLSHLYLRRIREFADAIRERKEVLAELRALFARRGIQVTPPLEHKLQFTKDHGSQRGPRKIRDLISDFERRTGLRFFGATSPITEWGKHFRPAVQRAIAIREHVLARFDEGDWAELNRTLLGMVEEAQSQVESDVDSATLLRECRLGLAEAALRHRGLAKQMADAPQLARERLEIAIQTAVRSCETREAEPRSSFTKGEVDIAVLLTQDEPPTERFGKPAVMKDLHWYCDSDSLLTALEAAAARVKLGGGARNDAYLQILSHDQVAARLHLPGSTIGPLLAGAALKIQAAASSS